MRHIIDIESVVTQGAHDESRMKPEYSVNESDYIDFDELDRRFQLILQRTEASPKRSPKPVKPPATRSPLLNSACGKIYS